MSEVQQNNNAYTSNNSSYNQSSALMIRLDTQPILDQIEIFLRGGQIVPRETESGQIVAQFVDMGAKKCNNLGCQSLLSFLAATFNPQVVQGNFDKDQYDCYIFDTHVNLATNVVTNSETWEIVDEDIDVILDFIMNLIIPFISRLIDNEERKGYADTIKTLESNTLQQKGRFSFGGNNNN